MKLQLDADGHALLRNGSPLYLDDSGKEFLADAAAMHSKIAELSREAKTNRERADAAETKAAAGELRVAALEATTRAELVRSAFAGSKYVAERMAIPADLVQARFADRFSVEDGRLVATDAAGAKLFSRARPGEPAEFEEALATLVGSYEFRDSILKGSGASGGGSQGASNGGGASSAARTIRRSAFDAITDPVAKAAFARSTQIVD